MIQEEFNKINLSEKSKIGELSELGEQDEPGEFKKDEIVSLTTEQYKIIELVKSKKNLFITGDPGTGKSFVLKYIVENVLPKDGTTFVVAPTGIAALNSGGTTIHSFAGIGLGKGPPELVRKKMSDIGYNNIKSCKTLIIDEISMVEALFFEKINYLFQRVKLEETKAFGGIQVIIFGDFHQLPPVFDDPMDERLAFESQVWTDLNLKIVGLTKILRQKDTEYINLLKNVKQANLTPENIKLLEYLKRPLSIGNLGIKPTKLYSKNIDVTYENENNLMMLPQPQFTYEAIDTPEKGQRLPNMSKCCTAPNKLYLRKNAQVMLIWNMKDDHNLVNGSRGVVVDFTPQQLPIVQFRHTKHVIDWNVWEIKNAQGKKIAQRQQIPLKLAWSSTIHKVQSLTIDFLEVDISDVFVPGMAYTCLSRGTHLDGLSIKGFSVKKITTNPKVVEFYSKLGVDGFQALETS